MKRLTVALFCLATVLVGACTTEAEWTAKMRTVHPDDPRYDFEIPFADP